jgi:serine/threonine protein kinase
MNDDPKINFEWTDAGGLTYRIVRYIDEGGMGEVYEGRVTIDGKQQRCAIKILHQRRKRGGTSDSDELEKRFSREFAMIQRFDSPYIVSVIGSGYNETLGHYYAMEFISEGQTLATLAEDGPLPLDQGELYLRHTLEALELFANENMIHRDIKPQNIMIRVYQAKIADFGLGKFLSSDLSELTTTGTSMGTPSCMSPEQVMGDKDITPKCDVYSTGATFIQVLAGESLFPDSTVPIEIATAHLGQPPKWFMERGIDMTDRLGDLLMMMVEKEAHLRPTAGQAMAFLDERELATVDLDEMRAEIAGLERPLWKRLGLTDSAQLAQKLDEDPDEVRARRPAIADAKLEPLAELHEQAGRRTPRYEPQPVSRYEHFLLAEFYRTEIGPLPAEDMLPKRVALERRRLEMIGRRIKHLTTAIEDFSEDETAPDFDDIDSELTDLKAFAERIISTKVSARSKARTRTRAPILYLAALVFVPLAVVGGVRLFANSNRAALNRQINTADALVGGDDPERAHEALAKADRLIAEQWYWGDVDGERNRIELSRRNLGRVELKLADAKLETVRQKLAGLSDPTREGAADTAELIHLMLGKAEGAIKRAAQCGAPTQTQNAAASWLRQQFEERRALIPVP